VANISKHTGLLVTEVTVYSDGRVFPGVLTREPTSTSCVMQFYRLNLANADGSLACVRLSCVHWHGLRPLWWKDKHARAITRWQNDNQHALRMAARAATHSGGIGTTAGVTPEKIAAMENQIPNISSQG